MINTSLAGTAVAAIGILLAQPALGQTDDTKLGTVNFETSCKPDAQQLFNRAMLYQHSFCAHRSRYSRMR